MSDKPLQAHPSAGSPSAPSDEDKPSPSRAEPSNYDQLTPDCILDALESVGMQPEVALLPLNSYENRVYQFHDHAGVKWVTKFYRPGRWSDAQILEEHRFCDQLVDVEIPVIAPIKRNRESLLTFQGYRFSVFPCRGGRTPELEDEHHLEWLGRFLARIHNVGAVTEYEHRPHLTLQRFGRDSVAFLLQHDFIPAHLLAAYTSVTEQLLDHCQQQLDSFQPELLRLHGDCHPGNLLWTDGGPHFVDFDDSLMGPAVQDLWMLLAAEEDQAHAKRDALLSGYEDFREFDWREWRLVEPLRALRQLHYSAWIARRWEDPSFKQNFSWFNSNRYWEEQVLGLREQLGVLQNQSHHE